MNVSAILIWWPFWREEWRRLERWSPLQKTSAFWLAKLREAQAQLLQLQQQQQAEAEEEVEEGSDPSADVAARVAVEEEDDWAHGDEFVDATPPEKRRRS